MMYGPEQLVNTLITGYVLAGAFGLLFILYFLMFLIEYRNRKKIQKYLEATRQEQKYRDWERHTQID